MRRRIPVIDLFAGPGGLAEGFARASSPDGEFFEIKLSIEKDPTACKTLRLRSFFRLAERAEKRDAIDAYFTYLRCNEKKPSAQALFDGFPDLAEQALDEVMCLTLGPSTRKKAVTSIRNRIQQADPWVLVGGPPCQAYSLVGRARMRRPMGEAFYKDKRHTLYKEYLHIIRKLRPTAFVMENVKGLLSSQLGAALAIEKILDDLQGGQRGFPAYRLFALAPDNAASLLSDAMRPPAHSFVIRAEDFGVPQRRHRLIIVGILADYATHLKPNDLRLSPTQDRPNVRQVLHGLPPLRSGISKGRDSDEAWRDTIAGFRHQRWADRLLRETSSDQQSELNAFLENPTPPKDARGARFVPCNAAPDASDALNKWLHSEHLSGCCNHETRGHIASDLERYFFIAAQAERTQSSPKLSDLPKTLLPKHRNAMQADEDPIFADRFRVQLAGKPSTTITSHISKDGHYFIHPDFSQVRSLTVREAARLQTFPDDYFFEGPRTEQYKQVGNAVPPFLARQIAEILGRALKNTAG